MRNVPVHTDAAHMNEPAHVRRSACRDELRHRRHVDGFKLCVLRTHIEVHACQMKHNIHARKRLRHGRGVAQIGHSEVDVEPGEARGRRMHIEGPDAPMPLREIAHAVRADESGGACDECSGFGGHCAFLAETATAYPLRPGINLSSSENRYMNG